MGEDCIDSKDIFYKHTSIKYRVNVNETLERGKQDTYNNPKPPDILEDPEGKKPVKITDVEEWRYLVVYCEQYGQAIPHPMRTLRWIPEEQDQGTKQLFCNKDQIQCNWTNAKKLR